MPPLRYVDFDLRIEREGSRYTARVLKSPAGEAAGTFTLPFTSDKVENLILRIGRRLGGAVRRVHSTEMEAAKELGGSLFEALFTGDIHACYTRSLAQATRNETSGLRLRLRLQDVPELADLPWEFLLDRPNDRFLAHSVQTPLVRYMEMPQSVRPFTTALPLRILVMISAPVDEQELDLKQERARLEQALEPLHEKGKVEVTWQEDSTLPALLRYLRKQRYHIFHFVGHGAFDAKREVGLLVLEDEHERSHRVESDRIGTFLHDHPSLRLAVLNSCEGARSSRKDPFAGVAANLVRQGIPAVVAMQFEISDEAAITFAGEFYSAIAEGIPVDAAVAEARKAIYATNDVEWATPVLYMRSPNGVLFKLAQTKKQEPPEPEEIEQQEAERRAREAFEAREARELEQLELAAQREQAQERERERQRAEAAAAQLAEQRAREQEEERERERVATARAEARRSAEAEARLKRERGEAAEAARQAATAAAPAPQPTPIPVSTPKEPGNVIGPPVGWGVIGGVVALIILIIIVVASQDDDSGFSPSFPPPPPPPSSYPVTLSLSPATASVSIGEKTQLNASSSYSDGTTSRPYPYWTSSDTGIATVSPYGGEVTGVAAGSALITASASGLTAQARVTVRSSANYDIPSLRANVGLVRLFETGDARPEKRERVYRTTFDVATTRYVDVELELTHPGPTSRLEAAIPCTFYDATGEALGRVDVEASVEPGETISWPARGLGWKDAGYWAPGSYQVTCRFGGKTIGRAPFTVRRSVAPPPPPRVASSYDIPTIRGDVQGIRFYEGAQILLETNRVYGTRFPQSSTQFVMFELAVSYPNPTQALKADVTCTYYRSDYSVFATRTLTIKATPGTTSDRPSTGAGYIERGSWATGTYRVVCSLGESEIARGSFEIVSTLPTVTYDIPALKARVTGLRFFEGGFDTPGTTERVYSKRFSRATARYIYAQLEFTFPKTDRAIDVSLTCIFYLNGTAWATVPSTFQIPAEWTSAWKPMPAGWRTSGNWPTGTFRVKCEADGRVIADDTFEIY